MLAIEYINIIDPEDWYTDITAALIAGIELQEQIEKVKKSGKKLQKLGKHWWLKRLRSTTAETLFNARLTRKEVNKSLSNILKLKHILN